MSGLASRYAFALFLALMGASKVVHAFELTLFPYPGSELSITQLDFSCSDHEGCTVTLQPDTRYSVVAKSLLGTTLEFKSWESDFLASKTDSPFPRVDFITRDSTVGQRVSGFFRSDFKTSDWMQSDNALFPVGYWSSPDWSGHSVGSLISECNDWEAVVGDPIRSPMASVPEGQVRAIDVTNDGLKDLLIFARCGPVNYDRLYGVNNYYFLIVLGQNPDGSFSDITKEKFGNERVELARLSGRYQLLHIADMNEDGYPEIVLYNNRDLSPSLYEDAWQSFYGIDEPYPDREQSWAAPQQVLVSKADGTYSVEVLAEWTTSEISWAVSEAGVHYIYPGLECGEDRIRNMRAIKIDGDQISDATEELHYIRIAPGDKKCFDTKLINASNNLAQTVQLDHPYDHNSISPAGSKPDLIVGPSWPGDDGVVRVKAWREVSGESAEADCQDGSDTCVGYLSVGRVLENIEHSDTLPGPPPRVLSINGFNFVGPVPEQNYYIEMTPGEEPILVTLIGTFPVDPSIPRDQIPPDARDTSTPRQDCEDPSGTVLHIPGDSPTLDECIYALPFFRVIPMVSKINQDLNLEALPLDQNPFYDPTRPWLDQLGPFVSKGRSRVTSVAANETLFQDVNGDDYIDAASWLISNYQPDCPAAYEKQDFFGAADYTQCRYIALFVNNQRGRFERVDLGKDDIPLTQRTAWQYYADLNGDGVMDIVAATFTNATGSDVSDFWFDVYYGRKADSAKARSERLYQTLISIVDAVARPVRREKSSRAP